MSKLAEVRIIAETSLVAPQFETRHPFEKERDHFECGEWFSGRMAMLDEFADTILLENVNSKQTIRMARDWSPDLTVSFGTRRIEADVIDALGTNPLNLHGGPPELYRGLDSHLWAIYHGDFGALVTTLHFLNPSIDDGPIVATLPVDVRRNMPLFSLRKANTETCVRLMRVAVENFEPDRPLVSHVQRRKGRYYSFMPAVLKQSCVDKFARFSETL